MNLVALGAPRNELPGDGCRTVDCIGQHSRLVGGDDPVNGAFQTAAVNGQEDGIVPWFLDPGKGILDTGDVGKYLDPLLGQIPQQEPGDAEKVGVPGAEHHNPLISILEELQHDGEIAVGLFFPRKIRENVQVSLVADEQVGRIDYLQCLCAEPFPSFDPCAHQKDFFVRHGCPPIHVNG